MNPWNILGWLLVAAVAVPAALIILAVLTGVWKLFITAMTDKIRHAARRKIKPAVGQIWRQSDGGILKITRIYDNGVIGIKSGNISWSDSREDWNKRMKNRKMFLILQPKKN